MLKNIYSTTTMISDLRRAVSAGRVNSTLYTVPSPCPMNMYIEYWHWVCTKGVGWNAAAAIFLYYVIMRISYIYIYGICNRKLVTHPWIPGNTAGSPVPVCPSTMRALIAFIFRISIHYAYNIYCNKLLLFVILCGRDFASHDFAAV